MDADINLAGSDWVPIGEYWHEIASLWYINPFSGHFDGNGYTISNLTINDTSQINGDGLFGYTEDAEFKDIGVIDCDVTAMRYAAGLVGYADNTDITDCYTTESVTAVYDPDFAGYGPNGGQAGGLVGYYVSDGSNTIDGCGSSAAVDAERWAEGEVGGFIGYSFSNGGNDDICVFKNCYALGDVVSTNEWGWSAGGFIGKVGETDIYNCYCAGNVSYTAADEAYYIGAFAGHIYDEPGTFTFTNCFFDSTAAAGRDAVGSDEDETSVPYAGIIGLVTAYMQEFDSLINSEKLDDLDSGEGAPVSDIPIWYAHSGAFYPDFVPENCDIAFDSQGATTDASPATVNAIVGLPVDTMPSKPQRNGFDFGGWWTGTLGTGTEFTDTTPAPCDMSVFAKWTSEYSKSVFVGGRATLSPAADGGIWDFDSNYLALTLNTDGTADIQGVAEGTTQVIYRAQDTIEYFNVTVSASELPDTGQDLTIIYILVGLSVLIVGTGLFMTLKIKKQRI